MSRPDWQTYFMSMAAVAATRSSCPRLAVGALIVDTSSKAILATGYNGATRNQPSCDRVGCYIEQRVDPKGQQFDHCTRSVHAEHNALLHAARRGVSVNGASVFVTSYPCWPCAKALFQGGISQVFYHRPYGGEIHPLLQDLLNTGDFSIHACHETTTRSGYPGDK